MAKLSHTFEYLLVKGGLSFANLLSAKMADSFGRSVGDLAYHLLSSRREISLDNLRHALGGELSELEMSQINKKVFQNIGQTFIELARFRQLDQDTLHEIVNPDSMAHIQKVKDLGRGGIFVTSHFGNWELSPAWLVSQGYDLDVVVKVQSNHKVDTLLSDLREKMGVRIIPVKKSTLRDILKALKQNRLVGIVADQHDPSGSLILDFFGRKAAVARGPASIAKKQNCPILPVMTYRENYQQFKLITAPPIFPNPEIDDEDDIIRMTKEYLLFFEDVIRKYPEQWMWTHRRWKV